MPISEINWSRDTLNNTPIVTGWVGTQSQVPAPQGVGPFITPRDLPEGHSCVFHWLWLAHVHQSLDQSLRPWVACPELCVAFWSRRATLCTWLGGIGGLCRAIAWEDDSCSVGYRGISSHLGLCLCLCDFLWGRMGLTPPPPPYRDKVSYALAMISQSLGNGRGPVPPAECWTWRGGILHALGDGRDPWPCWTVAPSQCRSYFVCLTALPAGLGAPSHSVGIWELMERSHLCQAFEGCVAIN